MVIRGCEAKRRFTCFHRMVEIRAGLYVGGNGLAEKGKLMMQETEGTVVRGMALTR